MVEQATRTRRSRSMHDMHMHVVVQTRRHARAAACGIHGPIHACAWHVGKVGGRRRASVPWLSAVVAGRRFFARRPAGHELPTASERGACIACSATARATLFRQADGDGSFVPPLTSTYVKLGRRLAGFPFRASDRSTPARSYVLPSLLGDQEGRRTKLLRTYVLPAYIRPSTKIWKR